MIIYADEMEQGSLDWQRARLGKITGSVCGTIMTTSRTKGEIFGKTAMTLLYKLAGQASLNPAIVNNDELFKEYLEAEVNINTKAIRRGHELEPEARELFEKCYHHEVVEVVSCPHDTIPNFAASPDGVVVEDGRPTACVEIKSVELTNFMRYRNEIHDAEGLKKANSDYYWQCQAEMMCTGLPLTYFIVYNPFVKVPLHVTEIRRNDEDIAAFTERVLLANDVISNNAQ